jgi:acetyl-CoA C-acetyltransferase
MRTIARDTTPVIVGVGQVVNRVDDPEYREMRAADLAAAAARAAMRDCRRGEGVEPHIQLIGATRTVEDSTEVPAAFGKPDKFPLAVGRRLGLNPRAAILEKAGGQSPLSLIIGLGNQIAAGHTEAALAFGAEATSTVRCLQAAGESREWSETDVGAMDDRGRGLEGFLTPYSVGHGLMTAPPAYALLENARRARLGLSIEHYRREMARLFSPFTAVAAANPYSSSAVEKLGPEELTQLNERNRMIAHPYSVRLVARDQVNQGAAVLLVSVRLARSLGIPDERWVFVHGCAQAEDRDIMEREDIGASVAAPLALKAALAAAGKTLDEISAFDFYSCFPIAVFASAVDGLGLKPDDPRGLTVTGGLPYFGGPGNNYSMHALAAMSEQLRADRGKFGLIGVNGGYLSKYGAAVLSTDPAEWRSCIEEEIQRQVYERPAAAVVKDADGFARIVTYTVTFARNGAPTQSVVIGEFDTGERFLANNVDSATLETMALSDPLGRRICVISATEGNRFYFA